MKIKLHTSDPIELPHWLLAIGDIIGAEGDDDSGDQSGDDDGDEGDENDDDASDASEEHDDADDPKVKGLKTALATERASNKSNAKELKRLERELKKAKAAQDEKELEEKSEVEQAKTKATKAEEKATKLAAGLLKRDIDSAIEKAARDAGFIDIDDALSGVDRSKITFEQDEDDPSDIDIDLATVKAEVKGLASRKKHLIRSGTEDGEPTGSTFGGSKRKKGKLDDDSLKERYPSLR